MAIGNQSSPLATVAGGLRVTLRRLALALLLAVAMMVGVAQNGASGARAHAASGARAHAAARLQVGIADQNPATFLDPRFRWLGMHAGRLVVPWDVVSRPTYLRPADEWLKAARANGITPLVVFEHSRARPHVLPTVRAYAAAVRSFMRRYPWVRQFSAWNEENHVSQPTASHPRQAAEYYNTMAALCRSCQVTAADVLDEPNMRVWVSAFLRYAHHPRLWGVHNYYDLNHGGHRQTSLLLRMVRGQIWFSEIGGLVWRYDPTHHRFLNRGEAYAARAAGRLLTLARLSGRITRIYYYHWRVQTTLAGARRRRPPHVTWDSGLLRPDCSARPAFGVIARVLGRNPARAPRARRDALGNCIKTTRVAAGGRAVSG